MSHEDLEQAILDVIRECCQTDEDQKKAKAYFKGILVTEVIDEAFSDE